MFDILKIKVSRVLGLGSLSTAQKMESSRPFSAGIEFAKIPGEEAKAMECFYRTAHTQHTDRQMRRLWPLVGFVYPLLARETQAKYYDWLAY